MLLKLVTENGKRTGTGNREPGTGNREPGTENRKPETGLFQSAWIVLARMATPNGRAVPKLLGNF